MSTADRNPVARPRPKWVARLRPVSLSGRVTRTVLALLAVTLLLLFTGVDLALSARLQADARTRITDRVALARQLDGSLDPGQLVDRLRGDGVTAQLCAPDSTSSGSATGGSNGGSSNGIGGGGRRCVVADPAPAPPDPAAGASAPAGPRATKKAKAAAVPVRAAGSVLFATATLAGGDLLTVSVDTTQITAAVNRLILLEVLGALTALLVAGLALSRLSRAALRPLDDMTALATQIAGGDRGRRLGTGTTDTELGRTAAAFDAMIDELEHAAATAERAEARMRTFLGDASHELRTPLAGVHAAAESLIRDDPGRDEREQLAVVMVRQTRRAARLVEDLLTVARLDGEADGALELRPERVDLVALARVEVDAAQSVAPQLKFTCTGQDSLPLAGDPIRLGQVLSNLLDNAYHATPAGGAVTVDVRRQGEAAVVLVTDTGPGVPAGDRERIFNRFTRLDPSRSRQTGGAGLGLAIARGLARAHGGDLAAVDPPSGTGAAFQLTIPTTPGPAHGAPAATATPHQAVPIGG